MEEREIDHINRNLVELIQQTSCGTLLIAHLTQNGILGPSDNAELEAILNQHEKSNKLYKIVLTRENAFQCLILALDECRQTGALEILKRLEVEGDSSIGRIPQQNIQHLAENRRNLIPRPIRFDVLEPALSFTGRVKELGDLHQTLQQSETNAAVVSRMLTITGLHGIGKTELARSYIQLYKEEYDNNLIWINAETEETLEESFRQLATDYLSLSILNVDGNEKQMTSLIDDVYTFFKGRRALFVFDNAKSNGYIQKYMPFRVSDKPYLLITSQDKDWPFSVEMLELHDMDENEAIQFLKKGLQIQDDIQDESVLKLVRRLHCIPLALSEAVAELKEKQVQGNFSIDDYLFDGQSEGLSESQKGIGINEKQSSVQVDHAKISYDKNFLIGKGSSGTAVFKGTFGGRPVAVKRVNIANQDELSNAQEEAKKLILCDRHVNVVRYFYAEKIEDYFLVALELCTCTLEGWVCKKVITANITDILRQITEGLAYLHSRRIIHRDIKPQNILLLKDDSDNQVYAKLADFGISKQLSEDKSDLTVTSSSGTEGWMAPELLQSRVDGSQGFEEKQGKCTDVFSLGCVFYYIMSDGKHPFGTNKMMRQWNILNNKQIIFANDIDTQYRGNIKLIQMMTHHNRQERCSLIAIRKHPVMWDNKKALQFLVDVSNLAENSGSIVKGAITRLEGNKEKVLGIQGAANWFSLMSAAVLLYIKSKKNMYNGDEVMKLIRAVRNMQNHYEKLPLDVKTEVGALPDQFMLYFISRFPNLISSTWVAFETAKVSLSSYYDENCDFKLEL